jgi:hypothetical protein
VKVTITFDPGHEEKFVVYKPCWAADNGYETALFQTEREAEEFACKRWGWRKPVDTSPVTP